MAKISNVKRLVRDDFESKYHNLVDKMGYVINGFMDQVTTQINGNIDYDNLRQDIVTVKMSVDSTGAPIGSGLVKTTTISPRGTEVVRAVSVDNPTTVFATGHPFITYTQGTNSSVIKIIHISGLPADTPFTLTIEFKG